MSFNIANNGIDFANYVLPRLHQAAQWRRLLKLVTLSHKLSTAGFNNLSYPLCFIHFWFLISSLASSPFVASWTFSHSSFP